MASDHRPFVLSKINQITENRISNIIAILPILLQSGMSPIRFLCHSSSLHTLRPGVLVSEALPKPRPLSAADVPTLTQEPLVTEILERNSVRQDPESKAVCPRPISRVLYSESVDDDQVVRAASGTSLVNISIDRGKPAVAEEDVTFERKAFINSVIYLLNALPQDLDVCELRRIQSALPEDVTYLDLGALRSILHRAVQMTVVNLISFLTYLMPYLMYLLGYAARIERKYKISEIVVGHRLDFVNSIGKQSVSLTETICQMNDGKVGQALLEAFIWTVDGFAQGISDGLGEGLSIVGARSTV
ncbi:hypothetical protein BKA56DRAFT_685336 [Ilyonectria sp. MPI-CAGE-AT-0026]|nr:hypothetical protein BKA56DRAFT_685336 [Ilyonectria sp. MPI-CAGE-AT-0026]